VYEGENKEEINMESPHGERELCKTEKVLQKLALRIFIQN
jgi:hypothetical protein